GRVIDDVHRQGGIVIAAHPVKRFWPALLPARPRFDAAEVMHPLALGGTGRGTGWLWEEMRDYYVEARASGQKLTAVAASDYHFVSPLGVTRTLVFAKSDSETDVLAALRDGKTVVFDLSGRAYGDVDLIDALAKDPYSMRAQDYGYRGNGALDRIFRALGLAAL